MTARQRWRRLAVSLVVVTLGVTAVWGIELPSAVGAFTATVTNSTDTAATNPYFTCAAGDTDANVGVASFAYPLSEASGTTANDIAGTNNPGTYASSGVTYGVSAPNQCVRDQKTVIQLDGSAGYMYANKNITAANSPAVFTEEIWFRTSSAQGRLIGYSSAKTGVSVNYDRQMYINVNGNLSFGVIGGTGKYIVTTPGAVTDGKWHLAVGTLTAAGLMTLYLDGAQVGTPLTVSGGLSKFAGFWRVGYDTLAGWDNAPASGYFKGLLSYAAVFTYAVSATQVSQQWASGN